MTPACKSAWIAALAWGMVALFPAQVLAQSRWIVASPGDLDPRISRQLEASARASHVKVKFLHVSATDQRDQRGTLVIIMKLAQSPAVFSAELEDLTRKPTREDPGSLVEGYILKAIGAFPHGAQRITLEAQSGAGFHDALLRLPEILKSFKTRKAVELSPPPKFQKLTSIRDASTLDLADYPSFRERGIVEGFYGKPWSQQDRIAMLRFEGDQGMNVYYYAPKDDPYHRKLWREPYPPARLKDLGDLASAARENFVDFCFAVSPGLSMTYSSDADFAQLTAKLDSVAALGVSCFALFLDDVPQQLENPQDVARYRTLAGAHVDVVNRLYRYLKTKSAQNRLVVTPTVYTNAWGSRDYIQELGAGVDPGVSIVWTGTEVASPRITSAQASEWGALLRRKPLVWDNFPVNDFVPWRVNLGPLRGRDADLATAVEGLFSNPMIQAQASKIPLQTVAEYLWNPTAYNPDASWRRALVEQYGPSAPKLLKAFAETYTDYGWDENIFQPLFTERRGEFDVSLMRRRAATLKLSLAAMRGVARYRALARELAPFPAKVQKRIPEVWADPAFDHLRGSRLRWRDDYDVLQARRFPQPPKLDGNFAKWQEGKVYTMDSRDQISSGRSLWRSPGEFSARFALGWDENFLYLGVEVTDPELYQPYRGRDIAKGDTISIMLETAYLKNFLAHHAGPDEYNLLFSPGNFQDVAPDVYSQEDYLPPRPVPHDYAREVRTAWRRTANGYSGDIALPASWFETGKFSANYQIGLVVSAQKAFAPPAGAAPEEEEGTKRVLFRSKQDHVFPARFGNPATYQRLVLEGLASRN